MPPIEPGQLFALLAAIVWAFALIFFKQSGDQVSPAALNVLKNVVAIILFTASILVWDHGFQVLLGLSRTDIWTLLFSGFLGIAIADTLFFGALRRCGVGIVSIVDCSYTPFMFLFAALMLGETITPGNLCGAALILSGIFLATGHKPPPNRTRAEIILGVFQGIAAMGTMAYGIVLAKPVIEKTPLLTATLVRVFGGAAGLGLFMMFSRERRQFRAILRPSRIWRTAIPGAILGTYISLLLWMAGFKYANASVAAVLNQTSVIFAVIFAAIFLKEPFGKRKVAAALLAFGGVVVVRFSAPAVAQLTPPPATQPHATPTSIPSSAKGPAAVRLLIITPDDAGSAVPDIFVSLSADGWPADGRPVKRIDTGLYGTTLPFPAGSVLEFKLLREKRWETVEKGGRGEELPNHTLIVTAPAGTEQIQVIHVARWADRPPAVNRTVELSGATSQPAATARPSTRTGDIRSHEIASAQFGDTRTVLVYLPPGYEQNADYRYPVLYMHDGNNVFDAATSFAGVEWGIDETCERLIAAGRLPEQIVVAIYNTPRRLDEYTPWTDNRHGGGRGDDYLDFVIQTVKPLIDRTYRTQPDRDHTSIAGSSLGGLISLYALFKHPDVFSAAAVESPALFWSDARVLEFVRTAELRRPIRIWLAIGTQEGEKSGPLATFTRAVEDCQKLAKILEENGLKPEQEFHLELVEGGKHNERDWAARAEQMLRFLATTN